MQEILARSNTHNHSQSNQFTNNYNLSQGEISVQSVSQKAPEPIPNRSTQARLVVRTQEDADTSPKYTQGSQNDLARRKSALKHPMGASSYSRLDFKVGAGAPGPRSLVFLHAKRKNSVARSPEPPESQDPIQTRERLSTVEGPSERAPGRDQQHRNSETDSEQQHREFFMSFERQKNFEVYFIHNNLESQVTLYRILRLQKNYNTFLKNNPIIQQIQMQRRDPNFKAAGNPRGKRISVVQQLKSQMSRKSTVKSHEN